MDRVHDFRSDTVTKPTPEMRKAMAEAEVGDDVLGDDPTVAQLEDLAAGIVGKESAIFMPSGTMANAAAVKVWTDEGDAVVVEEKSHIYNMESGHLAVISRVLPRPIPSKLGRIEPGVVDELTSIRNVHIPPVSLVAMENTHNYSGGTVVPIDDFAEMRSLADQQGFRIHLDGARIFNAEVASGVRASQYAEHCDSIMFCLSKGLGAPIGSILAGPAHFIQEARRVRKLLGGGMRQVGVIAAAGEVALRTMRNRLEEDHVRAKMLAEGLSKIGELTISLDTIQTNMVMVLFDHPHITTADFVEKAARRGLLFLPTGANRLRFVTHKDVTDEDVKRAVEIAADVLSS